MFISCVKSDSVIDKKAYIWVAVSGRLPWKERHVARNRWSYSFQHLIQFWIINKLTNTTKHWFKFSFWKLSMNNAAPFFLPAEGGRAITYHSFHFSVVAGQQLLARVGYGCNVPAQFLATNPRIGLALSQKVLSVYLAYCVLRNFFMRPDSFISRISELRGELFHWKRCAWRSKLLRVSMRVYMSI